MEPVQDCWLWFVFFLAAGWMGTGDWLWFLFLGQLTGEARWWDSHQVTQAISLRHQGAEVAEDLTSDQTEQAS